MDFEIGEDVWVVVRASDGVHCITNAKYALPSAGCGNDDHVLVEGRLIHARRASVHKEQLSAAVAASAANSLSMYNANRLLSRLIARNAHLRRVIIECKQKADDLSPENTQ